MLVLLGFVLIGVLGRVILSFWRQRNGLPPPDGALSTSVDSPEASPHVRHPGIVSAGTQHQHPFFVPRQGSRLEMLEISQGWCPSWLPCTTALTFGTWTLQLCAWTHVGLVLASSIMFLVKDGTHSAGQSVAGFAICLAELCCLLVMPQFRWFADSVVLPALCTMLLMTWPVLMVFLEPAQSHHIGGVAMWGLVSLMLHHQMLTTTSFVGSTWWFEAHCFLVLLCVAVGIFQFRTLGFSETEWFLVLQVLIPSSLVKLAFLEPMVLTTSRARRNRSPEVNQSLHNISGASPLLIGNTGSQNRGRDSRESGYATATSIDISGAAAAEHITKIQKLEQENRVLKGKAGQVSHLAHEVRTPLNALLACCTLLNDTLLTADQKELIDLMIACGSQITNNIDYVLEMARLENNQVHLENKPFNISEVCQTALDMVRHLARSKNLELHLTCTKHVPIVLGDANRVKQALLNLLTNSIKFTEKGSVTIDVSHHASAAEENLQQHPIDPRPLCHISIVVTDTGIGMTPEQQAKLFQPFVQASEETWGKYGGSGLGLTISQKLIGLMGGRLYIDAERTHPGYGSTFVIEVTLSMLPTSPAQRAFRGIPKMLSADQAMPIRDKTLSGNNLNGFETMARDPSTVSGVLPGAIELTDTNATYTPSNRSSPRHINNSHPRLADALPPLGQNPNFARGVSGFSVGFSESNSSFCRHSIGGGGISSPRAAAHASPAHLLARKAQQHPLPSPTDSSTATPRSASPKGGAGLALSGVPALTNLQIQPPLETCSSSASAKSVPKTARSNAPVYPANPLESLPPPPSNAFVLTGTPSFPPSISSTTHSLGMQAATALATSRTRRASTHSRCSGGNLPLAAATNNNAFDAERTHQMLHEVVLKKSISSTSATDAMLGLGAEGSGFAPPPAALSTVNMAADGLPTASAPEATQLMAPVPVPVPVTLAPSSAPSSQPPPTPSSHPSRSHPPESNIPSLLTAIAMSTVPHGEAGPATSKANAPSSSSAAAPAHRCLSMPLSPPPPLRAPVRSPVSPNPHPLFRHPLTPPPRSQSPPSSPKKGIQPMSLSIVVPSATPAIFPPPQSPTHCLASHLTHAVALLVEDNSISNAIFARLLRSMGFGTVLTAVDGEEGLQKIRECPSMVHFIFTDIGLPGMDGIEFTTRVRQHYQFATSPCTATASICTNHSYGSANNNNNVGSLPAQPAVPSAGVNTPPPVMAPPSPKSGFFANVPAIHSTTSTFAGSGGGVPGNLAVRSGSTTATTTSTVANSYMAPRWPIIIAVSGAAEEETIHACKLAQMDLFLTKPVARSQLVQTCW